MTLTLGVVAAGAPAGGRPEQAQQRGEKAKQATVDGVVIADAAPDQLIEIEGNWYFPPATLAAGALSDSPTPYTCPWKGVCQYHNVITPTGTHADAAWSYPTPYPDSFARVGKDFSGYVAFDTSQVAVG